MEYAQYIHIIHISPCIACFPVLSPVYPHSLIFFPFYPHLPSFFPIVAPTPGLSPVYPYHIVGS